MDRLEPSEKPRLKKWQKSIISIAHPDGHNFVKAQQTENVDGFFTSKKFDSEDIHFRPEAKGKQLYQLYQTFPAFIVLSTLVQVSLI